MPTYGYHCDACRTYEERVVPIVERNHQACETCGHDLKRVLSAPLFKFAGRVTPGGGPDRFTADMLGIPMKELPAGLRTEPEKK